MAAMSGTRISTTTAPSDSAVASALSYACRTSGCSRSLKEILGTAYPYSAEGNIFGRQVRRHSRPRRSIVTLVESGDCLEKHRSIAHGSGQGPHMVQAEIERHHSIAAHASRGRLDPHCAAERRRNADGSPVSLPIAIATIPEATAAAESPLEPPGIRSNSCGFRIVPK
jgi:hypothetical protein